MISKPAGSSCNMHCEYCYYLEKHKLFSQHQPQLMSYDTLEQYIKQTIEAQLSPHAHFDWHGGEALLRDIGFYEKAMRLQRIYGRGYKITNSLQTNGTLINDEWAQFLHENDWLVGISIDGSEEQHNRYRHLAGGPSHHHVMKAVELLQKHDVRWNALAAINDFNSQQPDVFYEFFRSIECKFLQFTPVVERLLPQTNGTMLTTPHQQSDDIRIAPYCVKPEQWGRFLCSIFDLWRSHGDEGRIFIQYIEATLANLYEQSPGLCTLSDRCECATTIEWNGDVYSCDHFVFPDYRLGNIKQHTIYELTNTLAHRHFVKEKTLSLPTFCRECQYLTLCYGGCPKNRFAVTPQGERGLNYLCEGLRMFFSHVISVSLAAK